MRQAGASPLGETLGIRLLLKQCEGSDNYSVEYSTLLILSVALHSRLLSLSHSSLLFTLACSLCLTLHCSSLSPALSVSLWPQFLVLRLFIALHSRLLSLSHCSLASCCSSSLLFQTDTTRFMTMRARSCPPQL